MSVFYPTLFTDTGPLPTLTRLVAQGAPAGWGVAADERRSRVINGSL